MGKTLFGLLLLVGLGCASPEETAPAPESEPKNNCRADGGVLGQSQAAIVGGSTTPSVSLSAGQRDAVGAMLYHQGSTWHAFCSATLVSQTVVLTAAHCVVEFQSWDGVSPPTVWIDPALVAFGVGDDMTLPKARLAVKEVHVPPNLTLLQGDRRLFPSSFGMQPDLAVVVLAEPAEMAVPGIEPIAIRELPLVPGDRVLIGGFGKTAWNEGTTGVRYWTDLTLVDDNALAINTAYLPGAGTVAPGDSGSGSLVAGPDGRLQVLAATTGPLLPSGGNFGGNVRAAREWLYQFVSTECSSVGASGICEGNVARWCSDGRVMSEDCSARGQSCAADSCGLQRCVAPQAKVDPRCEGLDYFGRCSQSVLEWCVAGEYRHRDCALHAQICGESGDPTIGKTCLDAPVIEKPPERPPDFIESCSGLDTCITPCDNDMWCALDCFARTDRMAIAQYGTFAACTSCAIWPDYCASSDSPGLVCGSECATSPPTDGCVQCIDAACGTQHCIEP